MSEGEEILGEHTPEIVRCISRRSLVYIFRTTKFRRAYFEALSYVAGFIRVSLSLSLSFFSVSSLLGAAFPVQGEKWYVE